MGGYGSSRWAWHSKKATVENSLVLDGYSVLPKIIKELDKYRTTEASYTTGSFRWTIGGREHASVAYRALRIGDGYSIQLRSITYGKEITEHIALQWTPQRLNNSRRFWFTCPGCSRRSAKLYHPSGTYQFLCRQCHNLTYQSSQEAHRFDRMLMSLAKDLGYGSDWRPLQDLRKRRKRE